jgi:hypothetical protein
LRLKWMIRKNTSVVVQYRRNKKQNLAKLAKHFRFSYPILYSV